MERTRDFDRQIVDKLANIINPDYLSTAKLLLQVNKAENSIVIRIDNNPWRNGVIKGDIVFARIKSTGDNRYVNFKNKFSPLFDKLNVSSAPVSSLEAQYDWMRIPLNVFLDLLNHPTEELISVINSIFINSIEFPAFGCCSKFSECAQKGKCVHSDTLYSTACQYRKLIGNKAVPAPVSVQVTSENGSPLISSAAPYERTFKGENIIGFPERFVVIDLETTGLMTDFDEIIEIAALKVIDGEIVDKFQQLVKPESEINSFIQDITGITNEMVADAPKIDDVIPLFDTFVGSEIVVGHNVNFDVNFLYDNYQKCLCKPFQNNYIDTMRIARKLFPDLPHHRLKDIVQYLNIQESGYHRALKDCEYTFACFQRMKSTAIDHYKSIENFESLFSKIGRLNLRNLTADNEGFDETHPLYKKECVFTGTLEKYTRQQAAQIVVNLGGTCGNSVTKKTNYLILGNNDYCASIKDGKSAKQKKAEQYKLKGQDIEIIPESVFYAMINEN